MLRKLRNSKLGLEKFLAKAVTNTDETNKVSYDTSISYYLFVTRVLPVFLEHDRGKFKKFVRRGILIDLVLWHQCYCLFLVIRVLPTIKANSRDLQDFARKYLLNVEF